MPRRAPYLLRWSPQAQIYEIFAGDSLILRELTTDDAAWFAWLDGISSFAFHSKSGVHCTIRKEVIKHSGSYWYAYRSLQKRTVKRYLGRTAELSLARLEEIAKMLAGEQKLQKSEQASVEPRRSLPAIATLPSAANSPMTLPPLLSSKLSPPRLPAMLVERTRLLEQLDLALMHSLTLLQAPAGFGKTTALNQWIATRSKQSTFPPHTWISLDASDNDLLHFWHSVIATYQIVQPMLGQSALALLSEAMQPPFTAPLLETILTMLLNDLAQHMQDALLVLDDYHAITEPRIHETLTFFLEHLPPGFHVILLSRHDPPLPLLRWRARSQLYELHLSDLRFSLEETAAFLYQGLPKVELSAAALAQLDTSLEGWAAGLRLLLFTLRGRQTPQEVENVLLSLGEHPAANTLHRTLFDYFVAEILHGQTEQVQSFLLQTSVLNRLNGPLCDAITGRVDSSELLVTMERSGLLLEALEDAAPGQSAFVTKAWYRYHALFAEALRQEASLRLGEEAQRALLLRASSWFEHHGMPAQAIETAIQAHDQERAALLIEQAGENEYSWETQTSRRWLTQMPEAVLRRHPALCLLSALMFRFQKEGKEEIPPAKEIKARFEALLEMAEESWSVQGNRLGPGIIKAVRALSALQWEPFSEAVMQAQQALSSLTNEGLGQDKQAWLGVCKLIVGMNYMREGRGVEAQALMLEAHACSLVAGDRSFSRETRLLLGMNSFDLGALRQAAEYFEQVLAEAREQENSKHMVLALLGLIQLALEWNDLAAAELQIQQAQIQVQREEEELRENVSFHLALFYYAKGELASAQQLFAALEARLRASSGTWTIWLLSLVLVWQIRLSLATDDLLGAECSIEILSGNSQLFDYESRLAVDILRARLLLIQGQRDEARKRLMSLLPGAQERRLVRRTLEIQALLALVHNACGQEHQAQHWLQQALSQAYSEGFISIFLEEGEPLAQLLRQLLPTMKNRALRSYARNILRAFVLADRKHDNSNEARNSLLFEPLSLQELRVLHLLEEGYTNPQIANELVISVNTVKDHVKHLYRKLGVNNRYEAGEVARQLKLS